MSMRSSAEIKAEIEDKLGFFPPFFEPALPNSQVLENLWQQTLMAYITNPLPVLFKESLSAYLSRYCSLPYCIICHSCSLYSLGVEARSVLELILAPPINKEEIDRYFSVLAAHPEQLTNLADLKAELTESLLYCSVFIATGKDDSGYYHNEMRHLLGVVNYQHLITFITYVKTCHVWVEAHREIAYQLDKRVKDNFGNLIKEVPDLDEFFHNYQQRIKGERQNFLEKSVEIAEFKEREALLQATKLDAENQELEFKVQERTAELNKSNQRLNEESLELLKALHKLEVKEKQLVMIVEKIQEGITLSDINGNFEVFNTKMSDITGYSKDEANNSNFLSVLYPSEDDQKQVIHQINEVLAKGETNDVETIITSKSGDKKSIAANTLLFHYKDRDMFLTTYQDITQRQKIEKNIQLSLAKEKELNELKASFIAMISHDLRNPMTTIFIATEILEVICSKSTETKANKYIEQIKKAIQRMVELIDDVLLISKASDRKLVCNPVSIDLTNLCSDLTKEEKFARGRDDAISFTNHSQYTNVFVDPSLLLPIFRNLLGNAIKYSPQGDTIQFEVDCQNNEAIFKIEDHGIGIPAKDLNKLFTSFHRSTNVGNIPGTGLGLSIVKNCVDLHGGQIEVESEVGVGTKFIVRIPLNYQGAVDEN
ncbi:PAS/PAC sensor signal transduction histidine kinase [Crinalium epipsammum PCC 9333]|uniref:histidine kinase n=1 Tax=Crinalium epipsammum PCC 9333 TaxID=1173022 RepID=K9W5V3_9CYAN|nr:PAS domain-containing sensor histidine kinase [Crinalium epipsammum]AFZ15122.1 PAS/PAC sensor signal transduction histidine kinase [Crinalium epipsammum PCC 9333]